MSAVVFLGTRLKLPAHDQHVVRHDSPQRAENPGQQEPHEAFPREFEPAAAAAVPRDAGDVPRDEEQRGDGRDVSDVHDVPSARRPHPQSRRVDHIFLLSGHRSHPTSTAVYISQRTSA